LIGPANGFVLADNWSGHDYALRNFTLLFLQHQLINAGFRHVRFLSTDPEQPPGGWAPGLDVAEIVLPLPRAASDLSRQNLSRGLLLLLDDDAGGTEHFEHAAACAAEFGATMRVSTAP